MVLLIHTISQVPSNVLVLLIEKQMPHVTGEEIKVQAVKACSM
jgi:hypothetical protein